jgi:hypothetical protein
MLKKLLTNLYSPLRAALANELQLTEENASKNIQLELQRRALRSTVDYIVAHMRDCESVTSRFKLLRLALAQAKLPGLYCEFGVYSGHSINYIARHTSERVFGFDSFKGLPEKWGTGFPVGHFAIDRPPKVLANVELVTGWFHETLPKFVLEHGQNVSFLHVDCDLYSSTKTIFGYLGRRIIPGTVIVFDEYFNYPDWEQGEFKAFREFIDEGFCSYEYLGYNRHDEQVAIMISRKD